MARKEYTAEEIIQHLRAMEIEQAKGVSFDLAARKVGVSKVTAGSVRWATRSLVLMPRNSPLGTDRERYSLF